MASDLVRMLKAKTRKKPPMNVKHSRDYDELARLIFSESAHNTSNPAKVMLGSSVLNRADAGREFGNNIHDVIYKPNAYYGVGNERWEDFINQNTLDATGKGFAQTTALGLLTGKIPRVEGQFFFTPEEEERQRKYGFKFNLVRPTGQYDNWNTYTYK